MKLFNTIVSLFSIIVLFSFLQSCNKDKAEIPSYIYIDSIGLSTNIYDQGAASHNITDIWVYINDQPIGVFAKNKLIPILTDDFSKVNIKLYAGIRSNGIKNNIDLYFLYKAIEFNKSLIQGKIDTIEAIFKYDSQTKFVFKEGFENGNIFNKINGTNHKAKLVRTEENAYYGNKCGLISLDTINSTTNVTTTEDFYNLPKDGNSVFLEMDYTCDTEFVVGISGKDSNSNEYPNDLILLKKCDTWNKLYLDLTKSIVDSKLESYKVYFKVIHPNDITTSKVYLDNIKLVYLNR